MVSAMLTWLLATRGVRADRAMTRLVTTYFVVAAVAIVVAVAAFAVSAHHTSASGEEILRLNIARYHG